MNEYTNDIKGALAGVGTVITWLFAHQSEIAFVSATGVSLLSAAYLIQGILLRHKKIKEK